MDKEGPYSVEIDDEGCEKCQDGRTWTVIRPDGVALGTSWADEEEAEYMAEMMNMAYKAGQESLEEKKGA